MELVYDLIFVSFRIVCAIIASSRFAVEEAQVASSHGVSSKCLTSPGIDRYTIPALYLLHSAMKASSGVVICDHDEASLAFRALPSKS